MKKIVFLIFTFFIIELSYCQSKLNIDYDEIKLKIEDENSDYYYPKLLKRFNELDINLTDEENALIYYGFSFQKDYIKNKPTEDKLRNYSKNNDYENVVKEAKKILDKNPISLEANNELAYALFKLNKSEAEWKPFQKRYRNIRRVIALSGDGLSCETAFKVIYVSDEYNMIYSYFNIPKVKGQSLIGMCDKIENEIGEYYKTTEIYFDASRSLLRHGEILNGN